MVALVEMHRVPIAEEQVEMDLVELR